MFNSIHCQSQAVHIIYHAHCPDGFAAALAARLYFDAMIKQGQKLQITYHAAQHGSPPPDCHEQQVYLLDFCYPRADLVKLCQQARHVLVIDHHISALQDTSGLDTELDNLQLEFDMNHSGAVLSWKYFQHKPLPRLYQYIEDRDIWTLKYPQTNPILSAILSYPMEFQLWEKWLDDSELESLLEEGKILNRERDKAIHKYKKRARIATIAGYQVPVVNAPGSIASDLLQQLAQDHPFAASYEDREDRRVWQLRSTDKGIDVSRIACQFGGGGHKNASGFRTDLPPITLEP